MEIAIKDLTSSAKVGITTEREGERENLRLSMLDVCVGRRFIVGSKDQKNRKKSCQNQRSFH